MNAVAVECELFRGKINLQDGPWNSAGVCNMSGSLLPRPREGGPVPRWEGDGGSWGEGHCGPGSLSRSLFFSLFLTDRRGSLRPIQGRTAGLQEAGGGKTELRGVKGT